MSGVWVRELLVCEEMCTRVMCTCAHVRFVCTCMCGFVALYTCVLGMWGMCANVYRRICAHVSVWVHPRMWVRILADLVRMPVCLCPRVYGCGYVCICVYVRMWMCVYVCTHVYTCACSSIRSVSSGAVP